MARVEFEELVPGTASSSATFNANAAAWDAATADIDGDNVKREGLDAESFADGVVEDLSSMGSGYVFDSGSGDADDAGPSAAYNGPDDPVVMNGGAGNTVQVGPCAPTADNDLIIRCSALVHAENVAAVAQAVVALQYTDDAGVTWTTVSATRRPFVGYAIGTKMWGDYTVAIRHLLGAGTFSYRLIVVSSSGSDVIIQNAVMFAQIVGH